MPNEHLTALARNSPSAPMRYLESIGTFDPINPILQYRMLDYGSGRGYDAQYYKMEKYDSYYHPKKPVGKFGLITCNYVLNVVCDDNARRSILKDIDRLLVKNGIAYISVRNDTCKLTGITSKGTWQALIKLGLPLVRRTSGYTIYAMSKGQSDCDMLAIVC